MLEGLAPQPTKAVYCKVAITLAELEESDKEILSAAIDDYKAWSANGLSTQLRLKGLSMADVTITKHRNQACACYRKLS